MLVLARKFGNLDCISPRGSSAHGNVRDTPSPPERKLVAVCLILNFPLPFFFFPFLSHPIKLYKHCLRPAFSIRSFLLHKGRWRHGGKRGLHKVTSWVTGRKSHAPTYQ